MCRGAPGSEISCGPSFDMAHALWRHSACEGPREAWGPGQLPRSPCPKSTAALGEGKSHQSGANSSVASPEAKRSEAEAEKALRLVPEEGALKEEETWPELGTCQIPERCRAGT